MVRSPLFWFGLLLTGIGAAGIVAGAMNLNGKGEWADLAVWLLACGVATDAAGTLLIFIAILQNQRRR